MEEKEIKEKRNSVVKEEKRQKPLMKGEDRKEQGNKGKQTGTGKRDRNCDRKRGNDEESEM